MANETQEELDDATLAFLDLVDCKPSEVLDIPPDRINADHSNCGEHNLTSLGNTLVWFGRYKGKTLKDLPVDYLLWFITQPELEGKKGSSTRRLRRIALKYIAKRLEGPG